MVQLAPSKNPEKESKNFSIAALVCGIASMLFWPAALGGLAFGVRGAILSHRIRNNKYLAFSIIGIVLGLITFIWYYSQPR